MWPGTTAPTGAKRRRRKTARRGVPGVVAATAQRLRADGLMPKAPARAYVPRCPDHIDAELLGQLGYPGTSPAPLVAYIESIAGKKRTVTLPRWKSEGVPGVGRIVAAKCRACRGTGRGCSLCSGWGWGLRMYLSKRKPTCDHAGAST